jgi:hypothetical protein
MRYHPADLSIDNFKAFEIQQPPAYSYVLWNRATYSPHRKNVLPMTHLLAFDNELKKSLTCEVQHP